MPRQPTPAPSYQAADEIPRLPTISRAKRNRAWEKAHTKATYRIPEGLRDAVRQRAQALGVPVDELARSLLEHGLACQALELVPSLAKAKYTLYPD